MKHGTPQRGRKERATMANIEIIKERVSNAEAKIAKKNATIEKKVALIAKKNTQIAKMEDGNEKRWAEYDVERLNDDVERLNDEISEIETSLSGYRAKLAAEMEKAASRNVPAIIEFLEGWKKRVTEWYVENFPAYIAARNERYAANREYCEWVNHHFGAAFREEREARRMEEKAANRRYEKIWSDFFRYNDHDTLNAALLAKDLEQEAAAKYDDIVERTNAICGTIKDAAGLYVGLKGELDGIVIGERGNAKVQTIGAGGYNIQCFHFRTLIHAIK